VVDEMYIGDVLLESAQEIFETMIYMPLDEASDIDAQIEEEALTGSIWFKGALSGCMIIQCGLACAKAITANMVATDSWEGMTEDDVFDAIAEVANMVMGSVKARVHEKVGNLEVSIPSVVSGLEPKRTLGDDANKTSITVNVDDMYIAKFSMWYKGVPEVCAV
jgi:chemotaxis protein CheX